MKMKIIPGINNSGPGHWQSLWEKKYGFKRVEQEEWNYPEYSDWEAKLVQDLKQAKDDDIVLIAHSLGCLLTVKALPKIRQNIKGIFLVAPPDPKGDNFPEILKSFEKIPYENLEIPGVLIYSENDEYSSSFFSQKQGLTWGLELINVGKLGHINSQSNIGDWDEGYSLLQDFIGRL